MSAMIERVARAIAASDEPHNPWENWPERDKETFRASARAAIDAIREPTDEMLGSVYGLCGEQRGSDRQAREVWQTMIDEALK